MYIHMYMYVYMAKSPKCEMHFLSSNISHCQPSCVAEKSQTQSSYIGPKVNSSCALTTGLGAGAGGSAGERLRFCGEVVEFADTVRTGWL